jgi:hypothetical protein
LGNGAELRLLMPQRLKEPASVLVDCSWPVGRRIAVMNKLASVAGVAAAISG